MTDRTIPAALAPGLALAGVVLWVYAVGSSFGFVARGPTPTENALIMGALLLGLVCHLGAVALSVIRWRRQRRWPVMAALYGVAAMMGVAGWLWAQGEDGRFLRANPTSFILDQDKGDVLTLQTVEGVWEVPLDACPGRGDTSSGVGLGSRQSDGTADISYGSGGYYMRLHVFEQRVECLDPPLAP